MLLVGIDWDEGHHDVCVMAVERPAGLLPAAVAAFGGDPGGRDAIAVLQLAPPLS